MTMDGNPSRRRVLGTAGLAACGAALSACSTGTVPATLPGEIKGKEIAKAADIPVGGGKVFSEWKVVVTQPTQGVFKAFTANCPHKGCAVNRVRDGAILCPCHGSEFAADTGERRKGPASGNLASFTVRVEGDGLIVT
ncbi:Rieske (2Fe-2S) protein [Rhizohabitans arisaemae]|uniref:Rieske (2Fe-2S) protein n=1 Tax=Rhizohabitans arisaemae TaxID=2720610 RepID=UPI0024B16A26|nr:Rieske (2Fe-2S) protein [Rhizohabitans arisaemae]